MYCRCYCDQLGLVKFSLHCESGPVGTLCRASSLLPHKNPPDAVALLTSKKADTTSRLAHRAFNPFFGGRYSVGACAAFPYITATHIHETD
jgi:hypothetical protein